MQFYRSRKFCKDIYRCFRQCYLDKDKHSGTKFLWVDNTRFKFITDDGIERLFNIKNNSEFTEEKFTVFPKFDPTELIDNHYYLSPQYINPKDQIDWMKRKLRWTALPSPPAPSSV